MARPKKYVLMLAPDFPPSSYPQAIRTRFFATHLPDFGWRPTVLTIDPKYYEWPVDNSHERLLQSDAEIVRTQAIPARLSRKFGIGDLGIRTLWHLGYAGHQICSQKKIHAVFISAPPFVTTVLGRFLYDRFRIPYVIDYNDPWISPYYGKYSKSGISLKWKLSHHLSQILEPFVLKHASHLVTVSRETLARVLDRYRWLRIQNVTELPHGGEPSNFDYVQRSGQTNQFFRRDDGFFHIAYVGRGGDDMKPALRAIFHAFRIGMERSPQLFKRARLHFIGTTYAPKADGLYQVLPIAKEIGIQDYVEEFPARVPYLNAIKVLIDSHALLAFGSEQPHYTASKIFPYILAKKPLLAVFREESSVVQILKETGAGRLVTFGEDGLSQDKVEEISNHLEEILSLPPNYVPPTSWEAFERYTARAMTERLAKVFDQVVSK